MRKIIALPVLLAMLLLGACAIAQEETTDENPFLGEYTVETVYVSPLSSTTFEGHAAQVDGASVAITEEAFVMEAPTNTYVVSQPQYNIEPLDEGRRQTVLDSMLVEDETLKRSYNVRCTLADAYGHDEYRKLYADGEDIWLFDITAVTESGTEVVMYVYKLKPR